jgi:hypothetical protein
LLKHVAVPLRFLKGVAVRVREVAVEFTSAFGVLRSFCDH